MVHVENVDRYGTVHSELHSLRPVNEKDSNEIPIRLKWFAAFYTRFMPLIEASSNAIFDRSSAFPPRTANN